MTDIDVKFFGNGQQNLVGDGPHVVRTRAYHNLTPRYGTDPLPEEKDYVAYGWVDDQDGSFAVIRIAPNNYAQMMVKNLDYIRALPNPNRHPRPRVTI